MAAKNIYCKKSCKNLLKNISYPWVDWNERRRCSVVSTLFQLSKGINNHWLLAWGNWKIYRFILG
jgi:hypothetical protein